MVVKRKKGTGDLNNRELLQILMQEIADVRHELKTDIAGVDSNISSARTELKLEITELRDEVRCARDESHQNQITHINNIRDHERRITVLEQR